jgi:hypothetical protein
VGWTQAAVVAASALSFPIATLGTALLALQTKVNAIITALKNAGLMASS